MSHPPQWDVQSVLQRLRHPEKRTWIMMAPTSIGETALACALTRSFLHTHGGSMTIVVPADHVAVTQMYPGRFERVLVEDRATMFEMLRNFPPAQLEPDCPFAFSFGHVGDARTDATSYLFKYPGRGGLSLIDLYRHILALPWDARLERPRVPPAHMEEAREMARQAGIDKQAVMLFPATSTKLAQFPDIFWSTLAARLKRNGHRVFCNMQGGNYWPATLPVAGTIPINVPMHLSLPLVSLAGRTISPPHGMQHLQLLGGNVDEMTILLPVSRHSKDFRMNQSMYSNHFASQQFMFPEVSLGAAVTEFAVHHDGTDDELVALATSIADQTHGNPHAYVRRSVQGDDYFAANAAWLGQLIDPAPERPDRGRTILRARAENERERMDGR